MGEEDKLVEEKKCKDEAQYGAPERLCLIDELTTFRIATDQCHCVQPQPVGHRVGMCV